MTPCAALLPTLLAPAMGTAPRPTPCLVAGLDMAGRVEQRFPAGGIDRQLTLPRARTGLGIDQGGVGARLVVGTVRSGGEDGYIGVDGEALVPRVEVAEARVSLPAAGAALSAGLVDDLWVATGNRAWAHRAVAAELSQDQGWNDRSDLGFTAAWTAPEQWVTAAATLTTGEGLARRERNDGQNTAGLLIVRPLAGVADDPGQLEVSLYARDGSRGLGSARDHRVAGRVNGHVGSVQGGLEWMRAWGVGGDARLEPSGLSAWVASTPATPVAAYARIDRVDLSAEATGDVRTVLRAGAGARLPWRPDAGPAPARLMVVAERARAEAGATGIAGAGAEQVGGFVGLQLDLHAWAAVDADSVAPAGPALP